MSKKRAGTLLEGVATKIGSTLGVVVAEASKVIRPLSTKRSGAHGTKSRALRTRLRSSSTHPVNQKRKRTKRQPK